MIVKKEREKIIKYINEAVDSGARKKEACKITGLTPRTIERWEKDPDGNKRPDFKRISPQALSEKEKDKIIDVCTQNEYKDMNPNEIVPLLAEKGEYHGSESSFYRVLRAIGLLKHIYLNLTIYRHSVAAIKAIDDNILNRLSNPERAGLEFILKQEETTQSTYAKHMEIGSRTAQRHLTHFVDLGLLQRIGKGPATKYIKS